jgi:hypothetical protein
MVERWNGIIIQCPVQLFGHAIRRAANLESLGTTEVDLKGGDGWREARSMKRIRVRMGKAGTTEGGSQGEVVKSRPGMYVM